MPGVRTNTFRSRHRLTHARQFEAAYERGVRKQRGPLTVTTVPNTLDPPHPRLGLSVGVRVGPATARNRCKRLLREAFRLEQRALPVSSTGGYDIVVGVRPPRTTDGGRIKNILPPLADLRALFVELVTEADAEWRRRARRKGQELHP